MECGRWLGAQKLRLLELNKDMEEMKLKKNRDLPILYGRSKIFKIDMFQFCTQRKNFLLNISVKYQIVSIRAPPVEPIISKTI